MNFEEFFLKYREQIHPNIYPVIKGYVELEDATDYNYSEYYYNEYSMEYQTQPFSYHVTFKLNDREIKIVDKTPDGLLHSMFYFCKGYKALNFKHEYEHKKE